MNEIELKRGTNGRGRFVIEEDGEVLAEMDFGITDDRMTIFHTEVSKKLAGQNIGKKLIAEMAAYAREHHLKVIPLCAFVNAQFNRHPELYEDIR